MRCVPIVIDGKVVGSARVQVKRCRFCSRTSTRECDYPLRGRKAGQTCNAPMCDAHSHQHGVHPPGTKYAGDRIDYCPPHHEADQAQEKLPGLETDK